MILVQATKEQVGELVNLSKAAFDSDALVGAPDGDHPPEYDSLDWHMGMMRSGHLLAALKNDQIVITAQFENSFSKQFISFIPYPFLW